MGPLTHAPLLFITNHWDPPFDIADNYEPPIGNGEPQSIQQNVDDFDFSPATAPHSRLKYAPVCFRCSMGRIGEMSFSTLRPSDCRRTFDFECLSAVVYHAWNDPHFQWIIEKTDFIIDSSKSADWIWFSVELIPPSQQNNLLHRHSQSHLNTLYNHS